MVKDLVWLREFVERLWILMFSVCSWGERDVVVLEVRQWEFYEKKWVGCWVVNHFTEDGNVSRV